MNVNMGSADRTIRLVVAGVVAVLILAGQIRGWLSVVLGIVALVLVLTSIVGYCPVYTLLGVSTRKGGRS